MAKSIPKLGKSGGKTAGPTADVTKDPAADPTQGGDINSAISDFNARTAISQKRMDQFRQVIIQAMFKLMKDAGVDPNDLNSIQQFLQSLEQIDPDIAELFDTAFNDLIGSPTAPGGTPDASGQPSSLMDQYSNLAGSALGQGQGATPDAGAGAPPDMGAGTPPGAAPEPGGSMNPNPQVPPVGSPWIGGTPMVQ